MLEDAVITIPLSILFNKLVFISVKNCQKILDIIPKRVYNEFRLKERRNAMDTIKDLLEIAKDLIEILVLVLTARQLTKDNKKD